MVKRKKVGFTVDDVEAFPPKEKQYELPTPGCHGLYLRVMPSGEKSWSYRYSILGKSRRVSLGLWPELTCDGAMSKADALRIDVRDGKDPRGEEKTRASLDLTMEKLAERFEEHIETLKPRTQAQYRYYIKKWITPRLGTFLVRLIGLVHLQDFKRSFKGKHRTANLCMAVVSVMLGWAEEQGLRPPGSNPAKAVKRFPVTVRHRFLDPSEIGKILDAMDKWKGPLYPIAAIRLLLLTGARRSEIRMIRWKDVDETMGVADLPDHKTISRGDRTLYLPQEAVDIIKSLPQNHLSEFVFAGEGKDGTIGSSLDHAWRKIREDAGLPDVPLHSLRHTWASLGLVEGLTLSQVGANLGHSSPTTTQKYSHLAAAAGKTNAEKVAAAIKRPKAIG
ncbi:tyrosine-type recombinase/integrase [Mesoterricola sediminis]|uniref:Integrase n=1 Tax=Mesoterricola sediminis TaxID=2927980 RepID=A0AA48H5A5_9BACT|nr:site-specific integrase [Mesoterricola sediminis]BDU76228.1 integrase [Mesoterricola sediminis]